MIEIILGLLSIAGILCGIRILLGPTYQDRVIALDSLVSIVISVMVILCLKYKNSVFIDIGIVYAILGFVGTVAIAKYLEEKPLGE